MNKLVAEVNLMNFKKAIKKMLAKTFPFMDNSKSRDTWVEARLKELSPGLKILDAGAGECVYKKFCSHLKYTSQDFNQYDGKGNGSGLQMNTWDVNQIDIVSDIINIPVDKENFDCVLCTEVLEHIPYPDKAILEFSRILKPGGTLLITAPFASQTHFAPYHFCTGFSEYWYREVLTRNNFDIVSIKANGNYFDFVCQELMRTPVMLKKYSKISIFAYFLYLGIVPLVLVLFILSMLSVKSETQLCFGYHICAKRK